MRERKEESERGSHREKGRGSGRERRNMRKWGGEGELTLVLT